ncbi:type II toxin-antitoxin system VapC family toxin [Roseofilum reptotaenium CS-1145]|uniref:VapC toxin family PIN domain ribonuclease n=1 Tax=Roseofilum reptotaenium AO1-A TaxID=1925591 RepID=A0A1L9QJU4_9CYAN|nr:type II toxin-antitoxin system VapC family toxin [Roseofilum reptotaenium]MDB9519827.1 type II toxin-antitoxin system VapC family toxin [Roseofilum reptotaenium CS-1145]OJJ15003.1 VapC toxin family PIN domain ribonuclease [Roseofilum reptotaenium AO1-A]
MINQYLLDTNILIYYFNNQPEVQYIFDAIEAGNAAAFYCPISWVELLCYPNLTPEQANEMREFLRLIHCVPLSESVLDCAAQIRRNYRLKLADGIIAACALVTGCILVTRNVNDFKRVNGLSILNPFTPNSPTTP